MAKSTAEQDKEINPSEDPDFAYAYEKYVSVAKYVDAGTFREATGETTETVVLSDASPLIGNCN